MCRWCAGAGWLESFPFRSPTRWDNSVGDGRDGEKACDRSRSWRILLDVFFLVWEICAGKVLFSPTHLESIYVCNDALLLSQECAKWRIIYFTLSIFRRYHHVITFFFGVIASSMLQQSFNDCYICFEIVVVKGLFGIASFAKPTLLLIMYLDCFLLRASAVNQLWCANYFLARLPLQCRSKATE